MNNREGISSAREGGSVAGLSLNLDIKGSKSPIAICCEDTIVA